MGAGLMMVYGVLILLFGELRQPVTILFSLPLSIGGAIIALLITGQVRSACRSSSPMAIAVIGGLVVSTALSLIFVPAVFTLLDDVGSLAWRLFPD